MKDLKKHRIQGFVAGLTASALLFGGVPSLAASLDAALNSMNITVNGQKKASKGDDFELPNGTRVPYSINYEGTIYLPVRNLSDTLGVPIDWDKASDTVIVGEAPKTGTALIFDEVLKATANESGLIPITVENLADLYQLNAADCLEEFTAEMSWINIRASEIFIAKVKPGKMEEVKKAILARQAALDNLWKHYLQDQYELVKNYKLVEKGDYIMFAVCENADKAVTAFEAHLS